MNESGWDDPTTGELSDAERKQIAEQVRVDTGEESMPLDACIVDLAAAHNEIEQYKKGALAMYQALDERLEEERRANPDWPETEDCPTCDLIKEVRDSAFGVYLRIQRGDAEVHGHRDGEYSGFFNEG